MQRQRQGRARAGPHTHAAAAAAAATAAAEQSGQTITHLQRRRPRASALPEGIGGVLASSGPSAASDPNTPPREVLMPKPAAHDDGASGRLTWQFGGWIETSRLSMLWIPAVHLLGSDPSHASRRHKQANASLQACLGPCGDPIRRCGSSGGVSVPRPSDPRVAARSFRPPAPSPVLRTDGRCQIFRFKSRPSPQQHALFCSVPCWRRTAGSHLAFQIPMVQPEEPDARPNRLQPTESTEPTCPC